MTAQGTSPALAPAPVAPAELDAFRGVAVLGIPVINVYVSCDALQGVPQSAGHGWQGNMEHRSLIHHACSPGSEIPVAVFPPLASGALAAICSSVRH